MYPSEAILPLVVSSSSISIPVTSTDCDDALAMDPLVAKRICLLGSSTSDNVFELSKEAVKSLDAGRLMLVASHCLEKRSCLGNVKLDELSENHQYIYKE